MGISMELNESVVMNGLFCLILVIATTSNSLLLVVFHRRPGLRTVSNRFVINLLATNLITCWILIPLLLFENVWREAGGSANLLCHYISLCPIKEGVAVGLYTSTVFSVLMIGVDQYSAVLDPLRYHASINATTSGLMMAASWLVATIFGVLGALTVGYKSSWYTCENIQSFVFLPEIYQKLFPLVFCLLVFLVPFVSVCCIYYSIYSAAHQNSQRTRRNGSTVSCTPEAFSCEYSIVGHETSKKCKNPQKPLCHSSTKSSLRSTSSSIVNSLKHRFSNASMFRYKEETRAAKISVLVIVMALLCWLPFPLLLLLRSPLLDIPLSYYVRQLGVLSLTSNAVLSPLIFAHRNRRVHRELCKLFRKSKRRTSFYGSLSILNRRKMFRENNNSLEAANNNRTNSKTTALDLLLNLPDMEEDAGLSFKAGVSKNEKSSSSSSLVPKTSSSPSPFFKIWMMNERSKHRWNEGAGGIVTIPEVALDVDNSRSSFSSNSSAASTSTRNSTFAASLSDGADH